MDDAVRPSSSGLASHQSTRIKTVVAAIAVASWILPMALALAIAKPTRPIAIAGLIVFGACLAMALLLGWTLYCPWCCARLFFVASMFNSPSWRQLSQQFAPYDIVAHSRFTCPHCRSRFRLSSE